MKKTVSFFVLIVSLFLFVLSGDQKKYTGPYVSVMTGKKFINKKFNSVLFGSISLYKKKKRVKTSAKLILLIKHDNSKKTDSISINSNEYFILQAIPGTMTLKDVFYNKRHYKIEKKFTVWSGDLVYTGNIRLTFLKSSLEKYSYKIFMDTDFKKLKFRSNHILTGKLNMNSPKNFLESTAGKILIPNYIPSFGNEFTDRYTPFSAIENDDLKSIKEFIKRGEDINQKDSNGWTLLMKSLELKKSNITKYLLSKEINFSEKTSNGWTALMFAIEYGDLDTAKRLIEMGADIKASLSKGWSVLFLAMRYGSDIELLDKILNGGADINLSKSNKWTPLMMALVYRDEEISERLIEKGADFKVKDNEEWTPLMYALRYKKKKVAEYLINNGADVNASNKNGWTPLLFALSNESGDLAGLLITKGASLTKANRDSYTPLHMALQYDFEDIALRIIRKGKTLNKKNRYGWSPLMYATRYKMRKAAELLLKKGVDIGGMTKDGWTTLHLALRYDQPENSLRIIKTGKIDINFVTNDDWTPLLMALRYNQAEAAKLLIRKGADINIANKFGWTPLMIAIKYDQPEIAKILIKKGANKNLKNSDGKSALDLAKEKKYFNIYTMLGGKNFSTTDNSAAGSITPSVSTGLKGIWRKIIPLNSGSRVLTCDNCINSTALCHAQVEYNMTKAESLKFIIKKLKESGYKYDKQVAAGSEGGSLKNKNLWGLVNFTKNSPTHVVALTIFILSDLKSGTTKTVADFNRMRSARKMKLKF